MNAVIELHDSTVSEIARRDSAILVHFRPAYLHKSEGRPGIDPGTGWVQDVRLTFYEATLDGDIPVFPRDVTDGELMIGSERYSNQIPIPLKTSTVAEIQIIFDSVHALTIRSQGVMLELLGESRYVEDFNP